MVQAGYPIQLDFGGIARINQPGVHQFDITESALAASVNITAFAFVSPVGNLMQALEALIQEPCGCFEQTSSTTYPLVMAQMYFMVCHCHIVGA